MSLYLAFDGGGSKCRALLFDENGPLAEGAGGGTNANFTTREDCERNIDACLAAALAGRDMPVIDTAYIVIIGPLPLLLARLRARARVLRVVTLGEGKAGLLSGALRKTGLCALSGTGSDAFYVKDKGGQRVVGAFGAILGDDGSGVWIGQRALRMVVAMGEGWGEHTLMRELAFKRWGLARNWDLATAVYKTPAPFRKVASFVPVVAEAARMGDAPALAIFREAGRLMALQMLALIARELPPAQDRFCVVAGGAWKAHESMLESFVERLHADAPDVEVAEPLFEPLMAGVVLRALDAGAKDSLLPAFAGYRIDKSTERNLQ